MAKRAAKTTRVSVRELTEEAIVQAMGVKVRTITLLPTPEQREDAEAFVAALDIDSPIFGLVTVAVDD